MTVTSTVNVAPGQLFAVGVTVYLIIPAVVPVLVNVCAIVEPQDERQLLKPVIVPPAGVVCIAPVQVYVVPLRVEFKVTLLDEPLQIV